MFMEIMNKPNAKSTIIKSIKDKIFSQTHGTPGKNQQAMAEAFYNELTKRMEMLGFLDNKIK